MKDQWNVGPLVLSGSIWEQKIIQSSTQSDREIFNL